MNTSVTEHIESYLKEHVEEMFLFLKQLVRFESPSTDPLSQSGIIEFLNENLESLGYYTKHIPGVKTGGVFYARPLDKVKDLPVQLLIGHCDTVWKKSTLKTMPIKETEDRISGPGVFDMKAGITQMIFAIRALRSLGLHCPLTPVILINTDEEIGSFESVRAIRRLSKIARRAYILEPPLGFEGKLKTARKGIGKFTLKVRGKSAHAGLNPEKGVSAIVELSYHIQQLYALNDFERGITVNVGMIQGGSSANVIAEESMAVVDVRVHNMEDATYIQNEILKLTPKYKGTTLEIEGGFGRPPMEKTSRNQRLWKMARDIGKKMNLDLQESTAGGGSDGNTTSQYTATLDGLGTTGDGAHARHEFIFKEKLLERTTLLTMLLMAEDIKNET